MTGNSNALSQFFAGLPTGGVVGARLQDLAVLLSQSWDEFSTGGPDDGGMQAYKLTTRPLEEVTWHPPILQFTIERHGAVAQNSTRAETQTWRIDIAGMTKELVGTGRRQLLPQDRRLDVKASAGEIHDLIVAQATDQRITWLEDNLVRIEIGSTIPATNRQTTTGRRKRFVAALTALLAEAGWVKEPGGARHIYRRDSTSKQA